jgi:hypothetical protein
MLPGLTHEEGRNLIMSVGTYRGTRRLSPVEVATLFEKAITAGASPQECARTAGFKGSTMIPKFLRLLRLNSNLHHLIGWGQSGASISFIAASEIGRLNEDEQAEAFDVAIGNEMTKMEVLHMIQLRIRSRRRITACATDIVRMRPKVTRVHVFLGAVTDESTRQNLAKLKQSERDQLLASALTETYGSLPKTSGRLGIERFTIVTDGQGAARLKRGQGPGFEVAINESLSTKVPKV